MLNRITSIPLPGRRPFGAPPLDAPDVANKEINITGDIQRFGTLPYHGLIVAHGDILNGYGVFLKENKLYFQVNQDSKPFSLSSETLPAAGKINFRASLIKDGAMALFVNGKQIANTLAAGLFTSPLKTGLRVAVEDKTGSDKVADYPDTFRLRAALTGAKMEVFTPGSPKSVAASEKQKASKVIVVNVVKDVMKFDKTLITATAGSVVQIVFKNPDHMQHNFVLVQQKALEKVGAAADKLAMDPNGTKLNYVPRMPEVLQATPLINPGGSFTLTFTVPSTPGDYPFVCTFPGHWRIMKGIMRVTKATTSKGV